MREHFDVVIVGSGFGGAVMACRLAEAGLRVCLLERGKAYPPGSFPRSPHRLQSNFWDPSAGLHGLYNAWSFRGLGALVSSGLGGGSLIYANVLLRKDERWFVNEDHSDGAYEHWPVSRADLDPHYDRVEKMMAVQRYPFDRLPYSETPKTQAFKEAARRLKLHWDLPNLAVTFGNPGADPVPGEPIVEAHPNLHGRTRSTCRLCGECDIGCNFGSKNTLDYTYLSEARRQGAELRTRCEVRGFSRRREGGYRVEYVEHLAENEGRRTDTAALPRKEITADRLVLAAGALGTPFLLLKNRSALPGLSEKLGTRFCGNGDLLSIVRRSMDSAGGTPRPRVLDADYGPVITSLLRVPDAVDGGDGRGYYIEDAGYPALVSWMLQATDVSVLGRALGFARRWLRRARGADPRSDLSAELSELLGECELSKSSMPLLGMGRDVPNGRMRLRDGRWLDVDWTMTESEPLFTRMRGTMKEIASALEADFSDVPIWYLKRLITVHPLGGCPMGRDPSEGVVDQHGEVFGCPGLFIADGSVMPGPVGPNPALTIAALADRFADSLLRTLPRPPAAVG